ncbi:unnamed protein product [Caenorhabditis auriculariae]|uniref:Galectin n=1 Tax=Caenorhabditis auriculariae TaxID=2777116 RepID=A0A8S1GLY7_9PELO|nr:unnamed protein product [Caenorhabditis auriculariae]
MEYHCTPRRYCIGLFFGCQKIPFFQPVLACRRVVVVLGPERTDQRGVAVACQEQRLLFDAFFRPGNRERITRTQISCLVLHYNSRLAAALAMASFLRRLLPSKKKRPTRKDSITGRNRTFEVPYLSRLDGNQLQDGQSLIVRGIITGEEGFIVNLTNGPRVELQDSEDESESTTAAEDLDDRLLALRFDLPKARIYFNACINGQWGKEANIKRKYRIGDEFDLRIRCFEKYFEIFVEHKLVANFKHYVPMNFISHVYVNGLIRLYTVSWEGKVFNLPYSAEIPGNFFVGRKLFISGMVEKKAKSFSFAFFAGEKVAFLFESNFIKKKTFRKSQTSDSWISENSSEDGVFPFKSDRTFDVLVFAEEDRYLVFVNDVFYISFTHKLPPASVDRMEINGDVNIFGVHLK